MKEKTLSTKISIGSKVYIKGLHPCDCRKINIRRYVDFFENNGYKITSVFEEAEVVLLWTCGFREDYSDNSIDFIRNILKLTNVPVIICGCLPHIAPNLINEFSNNKQCKIVPWKEEEEIFPKIFFSEQSLSNTKRNFVEEKLVDNLTKYRAEGKKPDRTFSDQFIKLFISEGCSLNCSYCSEKRTFPKYISFKQDELVKACKELIEERKQYDIMLIGDNVGEYGSDFGSTLPELMSSLFAIDSRVKIGVQNLNPYYFNQYFEEFDHFISLGKMLHLRLPVQSASDAVLQAMNRNYSENDIERIFSYFTEKGFRDFSTDIICGFPGETQEQFLKSIDFIVRHLPTYVNLSAFMLSSTIPAGEFSNQIPIEEKRTRVLKAEKIFTSHGIYCNTDAGSTSNKRRKMINVL